jgi:hypothetical protein
MLRAVPRRNRRKVEGRGIMLEDDVEGMGWDEVGWDGTGWDGMESNGSSVVQDVGKAGWSEVNERRGRESLGKFAG